jgi:malonyl CoA-acyl carrier protein transacylase
MLRDLPQHPETARTLEEATSVLGEDLHDLDDEERLRSTEAAQLALLVCGVASARVLLAEAGPEADVGYVAGHSVGVREDLAKSVMCPVRWDDATSLMAELGCSLFVEVLPGRVLSRLAAGAESLPRVVALANVGLRSTAVRVRRASGA